MVDEEIKETVKKTIEEGKAGLHKADTAMQFLEAMEVDTREMRKSYKDVEGKIKKMEEAYKKVTGGT